MTDSSLPRDPTSGFQTPAGPASGGEWSPAVIDAPEQDASLIAWAALHADRVRQTLQQVGALLFRGFGLRSESEFEAIAAALSGGLLDYHEQATPRSHLGGKVYSSTEYPARETIPLTVECPFPARGRWWSRWPRRASRSMRSA